MGVRVVPNLCFFLSVQNNYIKLWPYPISEYVWGHMYPHQCGRVEFLDTSPHVNGVQGGKDLAMDTVWWKPCMSRMVFYRLEVLRMVKGVFCLIDNTILIPRNTHYIV